jgi:hypothetical protein
MQQVVDVGREPQRLILFFRYTYVPLFQQGEALHSFEVALSLEKLNLDKLHALYDVAEVRERKKTNEGGQLAASGVGQGLFVLRRRRRPVHALPFILCFAGLTFLLFSSLLNRLTTTGT